jgi:hypothetical protein
MKTGKSKLIKKKKGFISREGRARNGHKRMKTHRNDEAAVD